MARTSALNSSSSMTAAMPPAFTPDPGDAMSNVLAQPYAIAVL